MFRFNFKLTTAAVLLFSSLLLSAQITGLVKSKTTGLPIANAKVIAATKSPNSIGDSLRFTAVTNSDGTYNLVINSNSYYQINVIATGYQFPLTKKLDAKDTVYIINYELTELTSTAVPTITGKVYDAETKAALSNVSVMLDPAITMPPSLITTSTVNGEFKFYPPRGSWNLSAKLDGYFTYKHPTVLKIDSTTVINDLVIYLQKDTIKYSFMGFTLADSILLPGVKVTLTSTPVYNLQYSVVSDEKGKFNITGIQHGEYIVTAYKEGYEPYSGVYNTDYLYLIAEHYIVLKKIYTPPPATLKVLVYRESSAGLIPVPGASLTIYGDGWDCPYNGITDSNGIFITQELKAGKYSASCWTSNMQSSTQTFTLTEKGTQIVFYLKFASVDAPSLRGVVLNAITKQPIPDAGVGLKPNSMLTFLLGTNTSATGEFEFTKIPRGEYFLGAGKAGFANFNYGKTIFFDSLTAISGMQILLMPDSVSTFATVSGFVYIKAATGLIGVRNSAIVFNGVNNNQSITAVTDSAGHYVLYNVPFGDYIVVSALSAYQPLNQKVSVNSPKMEVNFYLTPFASVGSAFVAGNVFFDNSTAPVSGATIEFIPQVSTGFTNSVKTNESGHYSIYLPAGVYYVLCRVEKPGSNYYYKEYFDNAQILSQAKLLALKTKDSVSNINFGIPNILVNNEITVSVSGTVKDTLGNTVAGARVSIISTVNPSCKTFINALTDEKGFYSIVLKFPANDSTDHSFSVMASKELFVTEYYKEKPALFLADKFNAFSNSAYTDVNFTLAPMSKTDNYFIMGRMLDISGNPITGGYAVCFNIATKQLKFAISDSLGVYQLQGLSPSQNTGNYYLLFAAKGYLPQFYDNETHIENAKPIYLTESISRLDVRLQQILISTVGASTITGLILDENSLPAEGVLVTLNDPSGNVLNYSLSNADGVFEIESLNDGSYFLSASKVGYATSSTSQLTYNAAAGFTMMQNMTISPLPIFLNIPTDKTGNKIVSYKLSNSYPNPFNPVTTIRYELPSASFVTLKVYDILGNEIASLVNETKSTGVYQAKFNGANHPSGVYLYRITAGSFSDTKKFILIK